MHLDRDDRGMTNDTIMVNGKQIVNPLNTEVVTIRGIEPGEFTVNVQYYESKNNEPVEVMVSVIKVNPRADVVFYVHADEVAHQMWGWPTTDAMPSRFVLLAAVIDEPNTKSAGALYVWVNALENGRPVPVPRAYKLPYTKDLHAMLSDGMNKARQGVSQLGTAEPKVGRRGSPWLRPGNEEQVLKIGDLPMPQLPEK